MFLLSDEIKIGRKKIKSIVTDGKESAATINLVYVNDSSPGISRIKRGEKFVYVYKGKPLKDKNTLDRIKKLVIPPAWENVWICPREDGHLQATGFDLKKRKQYKYHVLWSHFRNHTKFYRLHDFGKVIPKIRKRLKHDLSLRGLPLNKVLATVVCIMERTSIRIGNNFYEKLYGSFGLSTLKDKHVKIKGDFMQFVFRGKKGIMHNISLKSKKLAGIVKKCRDIPGQELFQYIDEDGNYKCIDSGMVNEYIKEISGEDFSAKDFRTWAGTVQALIAFKSHSYPETESGIKKNIVSVLDTVAAHLGNTRSVCKKYYVHPTILTLYEERLLHKYFDFYGKRGLPQSTATAPEEKILMRILERSRLAL
jgi:DNA topoisomerase-1